MSRRCLYCDRADAESSAAFCGNDCEHDYFVSMSDALLEGKIALALTLAHDRISAMDTAEAADR